MNLENKSLTYMKKWWKMIKSNLDELWGGVFYD